MNTASPIARGRGAGCWLLLLFPAVGVLLAAVLLIAQRADAPDAEVSPIIVDRPAPEFTALTPGGQSVSLQKMRGALVALNFWATWCEPCRDEMPALRDAAGRHAGLLVVGINAGEPPESVQAFARELRLSFGMALDPDGQIRKAYGVRVFPTTVWVDYSGTVRVKHIGPLTPELIERYISRLVASR